MIEKQNNTYLKKWFAKESDAQRFAEQNHGKVHGEDFIGGYSVMFPKKTLSFASGQEMYDYITTPAAGLEYDLYNSELEEYVFLYNDTGSICVYSGIDREEATELAKKGREYGEYWAAFLGWKGSAIYDTPDYENNPPETNEALEWCEGMFDHPAWQTCEDFAREVSSPALDDQIRDAANRTEEQSVNGPEKVVERA